MGYREINIEIKNGTENKTIDEIEDLIVDFLKDSSFWKFIDNITVS